MPIYQSDIDQLKAQIEATESRFVAQIQALYRELNLLQKKFDEQNSLVIEAQNQETPIFKTKEVEKEPELEQKTEISWVEQQLQKYAEEEKRKAQKQQKAWQEVKKNTPKTIPKKTQEDFFSPEIQSYFLDLFTPFAQLKDMFVQTYDYYKKQNRLPVLFMTLGGIMAILLGFSYLMQYVSAYSFELVKLIGSILASVVVLFFGFRLNPKSEKYAEFASALFGLSISINYLVFYYLSDNAFFPIFNNFGVSFGLILANTIFAYWLALRYETRIVLVISLLGGVFSPFYLNLAQMPVFYYFYVWFLCAVALFIASKISWKIADLLIFITASLALQMASFSANTTFSAPVFSFISFSFAYLFFYVALFEKRKPKNELKTIQISILTGTMSLYLLNLYLLYQNNAMRFELGIFYIVNALIFLIGFFALKKLLSDKLKVLFFIIIGTFITLAAPVMIDRNLEGIFWAIEGLALLFCGFNFSLSGVRKEAYLVLLFALLQIVFSFQEIIEQWTLILWTDGFINLISLALVAFSLKILMDFYKKEQKKFEQIISHYLSEFLPICLSFILNILLYFYWREWTFNFAILTMYGLIAWGLHKKLILVEYFGILQLVVLGLGIQTSVVAVNSYIFSFQTLSGKLSIIELFLSLWFLEFFYEKMSAKSPQLYFMKLLRELFYLLVPLLHLSYINRVYPDYIPLALWLSVLNAFVLNEFVRRTALLIELHFLVLFATYALLNRLDVNQNVSYLAASAGLLVLFAIFFFKKAYQEISAKTSEYRFIFSYSFYFLGLVLFLASSLFSERDILTGFVITSLYFFVLVILRQKIAPLYNNYLVAYRIAFLLLFDFLIVSFFDKAFSFDFYSSAFENIGLGIVFVSLGLFGNLVYQKNRYPQKNSTVWTIDLFLFHLFTSLAYMSLIAYIFPNWLGVWLTVILIFHAIVLLFNSTIPRFEKLLKLSIVYLLGAIAKLFWIDMENFETVQKVVVFMIIGVLMLVASFLFMKFREKK